MSIENHEPHAVPAEDIQQIQRRSKNLNRRQKLMINGMQVVFFLIGLVYLVMGVARVIVATSGGSLETFAGVALGSEFFTFPTFVFGAILAVLGYGLIWAMAALGAKEPPAWHVGRNGLVAILITFTIIFIFWLINGATQLIVVGIVWALVAGYSGYTLWEFNQLEYRLALGAERLRKREMNIFTMRNIGLVLFLSFMSVLGIVYALLTDIIELPLPEPEAGELLYITNFDDFNDEWDANTGRNPFGVEEDENGNQRLVVTIDSGQTDTGVYSTLNRKFGDFDLRVTTTQLESAPDHDNRLGVVFRVRDTDNYYVFEISGDGYYQLTKVKDGIGEEISTWIPTTDDSNFDAPVYPSLIRPGLGNTIENPPLDNSNEIRIVAQEDRFWFYVNGQHLQLCQKGDSRESTMHPLTGECISDAFTDYYEDGDFKQGKIGFSAGTTGNSDTTYNVKIAFDNVLITGPETPN